VRQGSKYCSERCGLALAQVSDFDIFGVRFTIRVLFLSELGPCFSFSCLKTSKATDFFKEFQNQGLLSKNGRREGTFPQIFQTKFFNFQIRLKTILPQRFNDFFAKVPSKQIEDNKKLDNVDGQITQIHQKLKKFEGWKDNVENFLEAIKNAQPNAERPKSGDDNFV